MSTALGQLLLIQLCFCGFTSLTVFSPQLKHWLTSAGQQLVLWLFSSAPPSKHCTVSRLQLLHIAAHLALLTQRNCPTALQCIAWLAPSKPDHQFVSYSITCSNLQQPLCRKCPSKISQQGQNINITSFASVSFSSRLTSL